MNVSITQYIFLTLVCSIAIGCCDCSSSHSPKEFEIADPSNEKAHEFKDRATVKNTLKKRQEDIDCAFELARIYAAISNIKFNFDVPEDTIPSQDDTEMIAALMYGTKPRCPREETDGREGGSYYVAIAGPTPTTRHDILAYEVAGNHGAYRHVLFRGGVIKCISEEEWEQMLKDGSYRPVAPVLIHAHSELMDLRPYFIDP